AVQILPAGCQRYRFCRQDAGGTIRWESLDFQSYCGTMFMVGIYGDDKEFGTEIILSRMSVLARLYRLF
ncbi:MAG: hypothetical protein ACLFUS_15535, partial [Candidatus Sumerlaeia bacterium]